MDMANNTRLQPFKVQEVVRQSSDTIPRGVQYINAPEQWQQGRTGKGVVIAVIDTGVDYNHPDLRENIIGGKDFTGKGDYMDGNGHGCIAPHDKIYTSSSGITAIEDFFNEMTDPTNVIIDSISIVKDIRNKNIYTLSVDEKGYIHKEQIEYVHKLKHKGKIYKVKTGDDILSLTPWHPVYVVTSSRGKELTIVKKRADELNVGDSILLPRNQADINEYQNIDMEPYWECQYCGHKARGNKRKHCKKCNKPGWYVDKTVDKMVLNEDLAYFAGLIASDGHLNNNEKIVEFCGIDQKLLKIFSEYCVKLFNREPKVYKDNRSKNERYFRARLSGEAYNILQKIGIPKGNKSLTLRFPKLIEKSPNAVIGAFLAGMLEGDGNIHEGRIRLITGSEEFAQDVVILLRTLGIRSSYHVCKASKTGVKNGGDSYHIQISAWEEIVKRLSATRFEGKIESLSKCNPRQTSKITEITVEDYDGLMYDLTVSNSHNYVANGMIVSNTHVCGTIAAANNGSGIVGVAPDAKILALKALDDNGAGDMSNVIAAIKYATDYGVDIISMSLGGPGSPALHRAVKDAVAKGIILVCAAGNEGDGDPNTEEFSYPGAYAEVIEVGAIDFNGKLAYFSNTNREVDILAPGVGILSTYPNGQYAKLDGTSMATPHMTGAVALLRSKNVADYTHGDFVLNVGKGAPTAVGEDMVPEEQLEVPGPEPPPVSPKKPDLDEILPTDAVGFFKTLFELIRKLFGGK